MVNIKNCYLLITYEKRRVVLETDRGQELDERRKDLMKLLSIMRSGEDPMATSGL